MQKIIDTFNKRDINSARGGSWNKPGIAFILKNRAYIGKYQHIGKREHNGTIHVSRIISIQLFKKGNLYLNYFISTSSRCLLFRNSRNAVLYLSLSINVIISKSSLPAIVRATPFNFIILSYFSKSVGTNP